MKVRFKMKFGSKAHIDELKKIRLASEKPCEVTAETLSFDLRRLFTGMSGRCEDIMDIAEDIDP